MRFLLQFRGIHNDMRISEFLSVVAYHRSLPSLTPADLSLTPAFTALSPPPAPSRSPSSSSPTRGPAGVVLYGEIFFYAHLRSEQEAAAVAARAVLLRAIYVPVAHGRDYPSCLAAVDCGPFEGALAPLRDSLRPRSFRCVVDAFGRKLAVPQQLDRIHRLSDVMRSFPGKVKLRGADEEIWILEDAFPPGGHGYKVAVGAPRQVLIGRKVAEGQGGIGTRYSLKRRRYIGPTSMDAELAFVMANMAGVGRGHLVLDPFCGTASILVACKAVGAHVVGGDINILALRGKGAGGDIAANFAQYALEAPLGLMRADVLNPAVRASGRGWFDAIVCDPPYGIKEGMRVFREDTIGAGLEGNHFQGTERVRFVDFLHGVLGFAAERLVPGGKLVYWLPTTHEYRAEDVPRHAGLRVLYNCEQPLTTRMSRRMITMVRVSEREREENERAAVEAAMERRRGGGRERMPAHFDLACKLLRQPERAEARVRTRDRVA